MKNIKIVVDSGCDISSEFALQNNITIVPFTISLDGNDYIDDAKLNTANLINNIETSTSIGASSCPSPNKYLDSFLGYDNIFVITLSSKLSGSFNSANIAKHMYLESNPNANVYVIDSQSAASGESYILGELLNLLSENNNLDDIYIKIKDKVINQSTYFILDDMHTLIKNGRIGTIKALFVEKLNLKLIMTQKAGEIVKYDVVRGTKKSIQKLADTVKKISDSKICNNLYISSCFAQDKVDSLINYLKEISAIDNFTKIIINNARGISTLYANKGGIVLTF